MWSRPVLGVAGATVAIAAAVVAIAVAGRVTPPELPTVVQQPDPPVRGDVAYLTDRDDRTCVAWARFPAGDHVVAHCDDARLREVGWLDRDTIQATAHHDGGLVRVVTVGIHDLEVDERIVRRDEVRRTAEGDATAGFGPAERDDGVRATIGHHDRTSTVTVLDPDGRVRGEYRFVDARHYRLRRIGWSPDGRWLVVVDSEGRWLVLDDRAERARVLLEAADGLSWRPAARGATRSSGPRQPPGPT